MATLLLIISSGALYLEDWLHVEVQRSDLGAGAMAEFDGDGGEFDYGDSSALEGAAGISSDEEYETMTPAEVLEKLEEVDIGAY